MGVPPGLPLVALLVSSVAALLCTDTRFLVDILDAQRPLYGYRHLLIAHAKYPPQDLLCAEELIALHGNYTVIMHASAHGEKEMILLKNCKSRDRRDGGGVHEVMAAPTMLPPVDPHENYLTPWNKIHVDLVVVLLAAGGEVGLIDTMFGGSSGTLVPFKHSTPILVIYTTELKPMDDSYRRVDVETIVLALRAVGWMHTAIAVQKHDGARLRTVPVYLSRPGFEPGSRCGLGPSTTTLAFMYSAGEKLTVDSVRFLEPREPPSLNGCDVHVAPLESAPYVIADPAGGLRGLDIDLVDYFAAYRNATVYFMPLTVAATNAFRLVSRQIQVDHKKVKGSFYQAFKKYDVVVGGLFPTVERYNVFDFTAPYDQDAISAFVTARLPVDAWKYPFVVLSPQLWAAVCGVMVLLVVVFRAMGGGGFENVMVLLGVLLDGEPNPKFSGIPKQTVFLVFLWTFFCMHFNSGYRASLAMAFIDHISQPGPSSIRDVKRVEFLFDVATYLLKEDNSGKLVSSPRLEICNSLTNCSAQIRRDPENVGLVMSEVSQWVATPRHFMDYQLKHLLRRSERLATFFVSFLVPKGSLLCEPLSNALAKTREFGLTLRAFNAIERNLTRIMAKKYRERLGTVDHNDFFLVFGVCGLLLAGLALATLVFCGELVHHRLSQGRRLDAPRISSLGGWLDESGYQ